MVYRNVPICATAKRLHLLAGGSIFYNLPGGVAMKEFGFTTGSEFLPECTT